jgi:exosome complex RNA-binding protein Rrp4
LKQGHPIICHVLSVGNPLEVQLSCEDPTSQKDWVTNEVYFGPLPDGGLMLEVSQPMAQLFSSKHNTVFSLLGQYLKPFETSVGVNGRIHIKSGDNSHLRAVLIADILRKSEMCTAEDIENLCKEAERRLHS